MDGAGAGADSHAAGRAGGGAESAHKGRRFLRADAGRRLGLLSPVCRGWAVSAALAAGQRRMRMRRGNRFCWMATPRPRARSSFSVGAAHSPDHRMFATAIDSNGSEYRKIGIRDLETGDKLVDELPDAQGDMVWSTDSRILFYTVLDDNHRPCRVMRHTVGTMSSEDVTVYENPIPGSSLASTSPRAAGLS